MAVGAETEVLDGLTGVLGAAEQQGVAAGGGAEGKLVEGDGLAAGGSQTGTGGGGESQGGDGHLGDRQETVVVGDGADNNDGALLILLDVGRNAGQGDGRAVDAGREQAAEDDLVEVGIGTACHVRSAPCLLDPSLFLLEEALTGKLTGQEAVQLDEKLQVHVLALGSRAVSAAHVVTVEINAYCEGKNPSSAFRSIMLKDCCGGSSSARRQVRACQVAEHPKVTPLAWYKGSDGGSLRTHLVVDFAMSGTKSMGGGCRCRKVRSRKKKSEIPTPWKDWRWEGNCGRKLLGQL